MKERTLLLKFSGQVKEEYVLMCCKELESTFKSTPLIQFEVIFDASSLEGYEPKTRMIVQNCIENNKAQIKNIYLVSESKIAKVGAMIMSTFSGVKIISANTWKDMPIHLQDLA